eukprot:496189-Rhodomonas_salina.1
MRCPGVWCYLPTPLYALSGTEIAYGAASVQRARRVRLVDSGAKSNAFPHRCSTDCTRMPLPAFDLALSVTCLGAGTDQAVYGGTRSQYWCLSCGCTRGAGRLYQTFHSVLMFVLRVCTRRRVATGRVLRLYYLPMVPSYARSAPPSLRAFCYLPTRMLLPRGTALPPPYALRYWPTARLRAVRY